MSNKDRQFGEKRFLLIVFGVNFAIAFLSLIYFIISSKGLFTLVDDFDAQQIPFNMLCNQAVKTGDVFWNWNIDIGSDFVSTFSFYNLGSPFFWITLLFPPIAFPYLIGWIYMFKYALAGLFSYMFIHRFVRNKKAALLGSMLYAFSGFQSCNLVFYHFHDVVAFFPLLMIGLEKLHTEKKRGYFAFAIFLNALLNYFFFIGEVIFLVIYYVVRFLLPEWKDCDYKTQLRRIGSCFLEGVIGVAMAAVLFVPSILSILQNPRVSNHLGGSEGLVYDTANVLANLKGLFFAADSMKNQASVMPMNWYSVGAYLPMVGLLLVVVYVWNRKDWISRLLKICAVIAFIPLLNNMFVMFTSEYYRRWYYMPVLIMALASSLVVEHRRKFNYKKPVLWTLGIMLAFVAYVTLYPWTWSSDQDRGINSPLIFSYQCLISIGGVILTYAIIRYSKSYFMRKMLICVACFCGVTTAATVVQYQHASGFDSSIQVHQDIVNTGTALDPDILPYRYKIYDEYNNRSMAGAVPCRSSFNSTISPFIADFYDALGEPRHVISPEGPEGTNELLSVGYYVMNEPWAFPAERQYDNGNQEIYVYRGTYMLPIGFTYNTYMLKSDYDDVDDDLKALAMLKTLVIKDEDEADVSKVLRKYDPERDGDYDLDYKGTIISERSAEVSENFWYNSTGFGSNITTDSAKYAFFSVPCNKGWSVKVNGTEESIVNINGLMAVKLQKGHNEIEFSYENKGLKYGAILSVIGFISFIGYLMINKRREQQVSTHAM